MRHVWFVAGMVMAGFALVSSSAAAQSRDDFMRAMKFQQEQLDRLQAEFNAKAPQDKFIRTWIDILQQDKPGFVTVSGWAFQCGAEPRLTRVLVDGLPMFDVAFGRIARQDVKDAYAPYCPTGLPDNPGVVFMLDLTTFPAGPHTVAIQITDALGVVETSNTKTVTLTAQ